MVNGWLSSRATFLNDPWERTHWLFNSRFTRQQGRKAAIETDLEVVDILQADAERVGLELDSDDGADQRIEITKLQCRSDERAVAKFTRRPVDVVGHQKMIAGNSSRPAAPAVESRDASRDFGAEACRSAKR